MSPHHSASSPSASASSSAASVESPPIVIPPLPGTPRVHGTKRKLGSADAEITANAAKVVTHQKRQRRPAVSSAAGAGDEKTAASPKAKATAKAKTGERTPPARGAEGAAAGRQPVKKSLAPVFGAHKLLAPVSSSKDSAAGARSSGLSLSSTPFPSSAGALRGALPAPTSSSSSSSKPTDEKRAAERGLSADTLAGRVAGAPPDSLSQESTTSVPATPHSPSPVRARRTSAVVTPPPVDREYKAPASQPSSMPSLSQSTQDALAGASELLRNIDLRTHGGGGASPADDPTGLSLSPPVVTLSLPPLPLLHPPPPLTPNSFCNLHDLPTHCSCSFSRLFCFFQV